MKILIISFFGLHDTTPRAFRAESLFRSLKKLGHDVEFISARTSPKKFKDPKREAPPSIIVRNLRSAIGRILSAIVPDGKLFFEGIKLFPKINNQSIDLTITIGLPFTVHLVTWVALRLNRFKTKHIIADYGDPFSTNPINRTPLYSKALERLILKNFNNITIPVESAITAYQGILVPHGKVQIISQGFNIEQDLSSNYEKNAIPTFAYAGALYKKIRDPSIFLEFLTKIEDDFVFHIYTDFSNTQTINILEPYFLKLGSRMVVHDKIPRVECLEVLSRMDFLLNFSNATQIQAPSKVVDYVLSGRPFLNIQQESLEPKEFLRFLQRDYTSFEKPDISAFDEINVAQKFVRLAQCEYESIIPTTAYMRCKRY